MKKRETLLFPLLLLLLSWSQSTQADIVPESTEALTIGEKFEFRSTVLKEKRSIAVHLPAGYQKGKDKFPVLYVLDGHWMPSYAVAVSAVEHLADFQGTPQVIVVGIFNPPTSRNRDTIPVAVKSRPGSGGSKKFLRFITSELMPYVDKTYRTNDTNYLYGCSNAGLFAVYAFLNSPRHFTACIANSPMIGHCPDFMIAQAKTYLKKEKAGNRQLYIVYGSDDAPHCVEFLPDYYKLLTANRKATFKSAMEVIPDGGHAPFIGVYNGLKFILPKPKVSKK